MKVFANRNDLGHNDRLKNELFSICKNQTVNIAVAFFSDAEVIKKLLEQGCIVHLIVRLNEGTNYEELNKIHGKENLKIKYFTRQTFHPKLYIVGSYSLYVGSSNLTKTGLLTNSEVNVRLDYEDNSDIFEELCELFDSYWFNAQPLTSEILKKFEKLMKENNANKPSCIHNVTDVLGDFGIDNITKLQADGITDEQIEQEKINQYTTEIKRSYGNFVEAFRIVERIYSETPERKWNNVPLRIEVDRFLWWLGETQYKKEEWKIDEYYREEKIRNIITNLKPEFLADNKRFDTNSIDNYFLLNGSLGSREKIMNLNEDEIFEVLYNIYAFGTYSQYAGGKLGLKEELFEKNSIESIKESLAYLLHSTDDYILRMYQCIKGKYKLKVFGEHSVKELYGYINNENNPTYNGRIQKSMSWLGLGIL